MAEKKVTERHSLWSGVLSFGLVNIPVRLYPASDDKGLKFNYLHKKDLSPISYVKMCKATGEEVPFRALVRGFQFKKGEYVVLEDQDFKNASARRTTSLEILSFCDEARVHTESIVKPFYLEPQKDVKKAYLLFKDALIKAKKVAIGKFVLKTREHLCMLKPEKNVILLEQLRYYSELKSPYGLDLPDKERYSDDELDLALQLIKRLDRPFDPEKLRDTYSDNLRTLIAHKAKGKTFQIKEEKVSPTKVVDLMAKLKESLSHQKTAAGARADG